MSDFAADCGAEKMHTCLSEDETVEGHAHGPQVQSLGESEQRRHFRAYSLLPSRTGANLFHLFISVGKYGTPWSMTWMLNLNQTENETNRTDWSAQALVSSRLSYLDWRNQNIKFWTRLDEQPKTIIFGYARICGGINLSWNGYGHPERCAKTSLFQRRRSAFRLISGRSLDFFPNDSEEPTHFPAEALPCVWEGLRSHKSGRAGGTGQQSVVAFKLVADPKVCYLHVAIIAQQQVWGLDIPMDDLLVMHWGGRSLRVTRWLRLVLICTFHSTENLTASRRFPDQVSPGHFPGWRSAACWNMRLLNCN